MILTLIVQVYIVAGGLGNSRLGVLGHTETLEKNGGNAWQRVASLSEARYALTGLGLNNGRFMVTGQYSSTHM